MSEASLDEDLERAAQLLASGAQPNDPKDCNTALLDALGRQSAEMTRLLLEQGADPNRAAPDTSKRPLLVAIESGRQELWALLLEYGAQTELVSWWDIVAGSDDPERVQAALDARLDPNLPSAESGTTALHIAAMYGYVDSLDLLLQAGADPNARDTLGNSPLDLAKRNHHSEAVQRLEGRAAP